MGLHLSVLASSSAANAIFVASDTTAVLVDAGLSLKQIEQRLAAIDARPDHLAGICLSHEHSDHILGVPPLQRRYGLPVYANAGTLEGARRVWKDRGALCRVFSTGQPFRIGDLRIEPFAVPHDAYDPVGFVIECDGVRVGIATDMGIPTTLARERLRGCAAVVIEANHDERMLHQSARPWALKQRILGRQGHLSNRHAAEMIAEIAGPAMRRVVLAHISAECNTPELAVGEVRGRLQERGWTHIEVIPAEQATGLRWTLAMETMGAKAHGGDPSI